MPAQRPNISLKLLLLILQLQVPHKREQKQHLHMNSKAISFFLFSTLALLFSAARAQERAPHGLANENPVAFSPEAVEFFRPKTQVPNTKNPSAELSGCSPLPLAAQVDDTRAEESLLSTSQKGGRGLGAGSIAGIVLGLSFFVLLAMGGFYVFISRRANSTQSNFVKADSHACRVHGDPFRRNSKGPCSSNSIINSPQETTVATAY